MTQPQTTKLTTPYHITMTPDIGGYIDKLSDALHLMRSKDLTMRELEDRISKIIDKMKRDDYARRI